MLIGAPHFCAGAFIVAGKVIDAAPILAYMIGWDLDKMLNYIKTKGWEIVK